MKIVSIKDNKLLLNSGVTESNFGRMSYGELLQESGLLAVSDLNEKGNYNFAFDPWYFDDVISLEVENCDERKVFYSGNIPLEASSFSDLTNCNFDDSFAVVSAMTQIAIQNEKWPENGGGGTLIFKNDKKIAILFLPQNLFSYSVQALSLEDQGIEQNLWKNVNLHELDSICFTRSTIVYKLLTGKFPYPDYRAVNRNADILDSKFTPVDFYIPSLSEDLKKALNIPLSLNSKILDQIAKGKKSAMEFKSNADFSLRDLYSLKDSIPALLESVEKNAGNDQYQEWIKKQNKKIGVKRYVRRNRAFIIVIAIILVGVALLITDSVKSKLSNPTSIGLTAEETLEAYYQAFGKIDTTVIDTFATGKGTKDYTKIISQCFVISKQRESVDPNMALMTPAGYLLYATDAKNANYAGLFGITDLRIDGKPQDMITNVKKRNQKPVPLTEEKGVTLKDGMTSVHKVNFYRMHSEGEENDIYVEYHTDIVTLTFEKNRWMLTNIDTTATDIEVNTKEFLNDYWNAMDFHNQNIKETMITMHAKYSWLPTTYDIEMEEREKEIERRELMYKFYGIQS